MDNFIIIILKLQVGYAVDGRNFHILRYEEATLVYTWFSLNCMLTQTACLVACQTYLVLLLSPLKQRMCSSSSYTKGEGMLLMGFPKQRIKPTVMQATRLSSLLYWTTDKMPGAFVRQLAWPKWEGGWALTARPCHLNVWLCSTTDLLIMPIL